MSTRAERKAKGLYNKWDETDLQKAISAVNDGMGINKAAREFNIPMSTLKRKIKHGSASKPIGRPQDLPQKVEQELVSHLLKLESMFYGLTRKGVMELAYEIAKKNNIKTRFNDEKGMAGKEWFEGFMRRHPELTLRRPEPTSLARASGFNKTVVNKFFDILEKLVDENNITASKIFNMDETSHTVVQRPEKILAQKGKHQVGAATTCEKGQNVTGVYAMSATGVFVPPMLIYARKRMRVSLTFGAPPGTVFKCQEKGWMNAEVFVDWMHHFINIVKPSVQEKVLLILDGHRSHTQSLEAIELARLHGVVMLSLPSHCTHRLQPLDVAFFKPLKTFTGSAISSKLRENPGKHLRVDDIASIVGKAFPRAALVETAMNGFRKTGLWPVDRHVFIEADFAAASVTDRPIKEPGPSSQQIDYDSEIASVSSKDDRRTSPDRNLDVNTVEMNYESGVTVAPSKEKFYTSVSEISPIPSSSTTELRKKRRQTSSGVVLTSTPHKETLKSERRPTLSKGKRKQLFGNKAKSSKKKKPDRQNENICINCGDDFESDWIQCNKCKFWSHEDCADLNDPLYFHCFNCKD